MFGIFKRKQGRDQHGRFTKGNTCAKQATTGSKRKANTKQIVSPVDIARDQFLQLQPQFIEHPLPKAGIMKVFIWGDHHWLDDKLQRRPQKMINIEPTLKYLKENAPWDVIVFGGDTWDLDYLSHWNSNKFDDIGHNRIEEYVNSEANSLHMLIKKVKEISKAKAMYYIEGNHELWLWQYQEKHQKLNKQTLDNWLRLDELGVKFIPTYGALTIGKHIVIRHGECYRTENPAKQAIMKSHRTVFMLHHHKLIVWSGYSDADVMEKIQAYCVPGMCNVCAMDYMKNSPNNWSCGFAVLYVKPSGKFTPNIQVVSPKGNFLRNGKEYE